MSEEEGYPEDAPKRGYHIDESNGHIIRTDKNSVTHVATIIEGVLSIKPDHTNFRGPIVKWLNANDWDIVQTLVEGDEATAKKEIEIAKTTTIPPQPKMTRQLGDKTPELMEWYRKYKPAEYKARYGIQGMGTVIRTRTVLDEEGNAVQEQYEEQALLARRKTAHTEKIEAGAGEDSLYSD